MKKTFAEVLEIKNGRNQKTVENPNGRYPIYGSGGIMGRADDFICNAGTVIVGRKGTINNPIFVNEPFWNVDTAFGLEANRDILYPKYLFYFCKNFDFESLNTTVTIPSLTKNNLLKVNIPIVALEEQIKIAAELDTIQSAIDNKKQQLSLLDEAVKSKFVEMFGDVIQNTKNWELKNFPEIAKSRLGKMLDSKKQTGKEKYPYLANFNVQWFRFNLENLNEMDFSEADRIEFSLKDGDLLVCEGGEVGRCAVWHNQIENCFFQKAVHRVRLNKELIHPDYMAFWFKFRSDFNSFDDIVGSKATIAHLTGEKLKLLTIPVPPLDLQNQFAAFVQQIDKAKSIAKQQIADLQELLDSKMQAYFG